MGRPHRWRGSHLENDSCQATPMRAIDANATAICLLRSKFASYERLDHTS
jgi:hypothetical protein